MSDTTNKVKILFEIDAAGAISGGNKINDVLGRQADSLSKIEKLNVKAIETDQIRSALMQSYSLKIEKAQNLYTTLQEKVAKLNATPLNDPLKQGALIATAEAYKRKINEITDAILRAQNTLAKFNRENGLVQKFTGSPTNAFSTADFATSQIPSKSQTEANQIDALTIAERQNRSRIATRDAAQANANEILFEEQTRRQQLASMRRDIIARNDERIRLEQEGAARLARVMAEQRNYNTNNSAQFNAGLQQQEALRRASIDRQIAIETYGVNSIQVRRVQAAEQGRQIEERYQAQIAAIRARVANGTLGSSSALRQTTQAQEQYRQQIVQTTQALNQQESAHRQSIATQRNLFVRIGEIIGIYRIYNATLQLVQSALLSIPNALLSFQQTQASMNAIFGSQDGANNLKFLRDLAIEAGHDIVSLEEAYRKFAPSAVLAGATQKDVNQIFSDFTKVGTVLGLSEDGLQRIYLALEQMYAKSTVQSEEIKRQLGNVLPGAVEIGARAWAKYTDSADKSVTAFMAAMKKNLVETRKFAPEFAKEYAQIFAGPDDSVFLDVATKLRSNLGRLSTEYTLLSRDLGNKAEGIMNDTVKFAANLLSGLREQLGGILQIIEAISVIATTRVAASLVKWAAGTTAVSTGILGLTTDVNNLSLLFTKLGSILATVFSPFTIAAAAVVGSIGTIAAATTDLTYKYEKFGNLSDEYVKNQMAIYAAQGKGADEAGFRLQELAKLQEKSNSLFIEYKGTQIELGTIVGVVWDKITASIKNDIEEVKLAFTSIPQSWLDTWNKVVDITTKILNTIVDHVTAGVKTIGDAFQKNIFQLSNFNIGDVYAKNLASSKGTLDKAATNVTNYVGGIADDILTKAADKQFKLTQENLKKKIDFKGLDVPEVTDPIAQANKASAASTTAAHKEQTAYYQDMVRNSNIAVSSVKQEETAIDNKYKNNIISLQDYVAKKKALIDKETAMQIEAYSVLEQKAKKFGDTAKAAEFHDKIIAIGGDLATHTYGEADKRQQEILQLEITEKEKLVNIIDSIHQKYQDNLGIERDETAEMTKQQRLQKERLLLEGKTNAVKELELNTIITKNKKQASIIQVETTTANDAYNISLQNTNNLLQSGAISQLNAMMRNDEARQARLKLFEQEDAANQKILNSTPENAQTAALKKQVQDTHLAAEKLRSEGSSVANFFKNNVSTAIVDSFSSYVTGAATAKQAFRSLADSMIQMINKVIASELQANVINKLFDVGINAFKGGGSSSSVASTAETGIGAAIGAFFASANGNVMQGASISQYSGTIVNKPTFFAKGGNVMGEAGPEGILPLARNKQGKLGVYTTGNTAAGVNIQNINVTVGDNKDQTSEEQAQAIGKAIKDQLTVMVDQRLITNSRSGGLLNPTRMVASF